MSKNFKIRNRANSCSRNTKLNSTLTSTAKYDLQKDVAELIDLISECDKNKDQVYSVYSLDSSSASLELKSLNDTIQKLKAKIQQQEYESKVSSNQALKNRYRTLINVGSSSKTKDNPNEASESKQQVLMYRVLRKLNQDATYALEQFKESIIQSEEDYEDDY